MSYPTLLTFSDIGTMVASATESMLYRSTVNWQEASKATVIGIVSRYIEFYMVGYMPSVFSKFSTDPKSQLVVFVVAAIYSRAMNKKQGALLYGFKTATSDLWGSNMVSFLGFSPDTPILGAGASVNDKSWGSYFIGGAAKP